MKLISTNSSKDFFSGRASILGIETSCDETAAAVISINGCLLSNILNSQHDVHRRFGGVVPELASRRHTERLEEIIDEAMHVAHVDWKDLQAIAVTRGPGLAGALVVGVSFAKALAYTLRIPWISIHHLEGHIASAWLEDPAFMTPCIVFVISGGHTHLYFVRGPRDYQLIGRSLDDAAGEAFDKGAKMLKLGYPGGPAVDRMAKSGNPNVVRFPRPYLNRGGLNFSFSGIKTSLLYYLRDLEWQGQSKVIADIAASYQEAIVEVLVEKAFRAVRQHKVKRLAVVGGVSANTRLRELFEKRAEETGIYLVLPRIEYCTDNAAMIAAAGLWSYQQGEYASWDMDAQANLDMSVLNLTESIC